jgi:hypothetical protein
MSIVSINKTIFLIIPSFNDFFKEAFQGKYRTCIRDSSDFSLNDYTDITIIYKHVPVYPEMVPDNTLDPITSCCFTNFPCDGNPKAGVL